MIGRRWFFDEDVERRTGRLARFQRIQQRGLVDDAAARAIDNAHTLFHHCEGPSVNEATRLLRQRRMHGNEIGVAVDSLEIDQLDAGLPGSLGGEYRIETYHLHFKAVRTIG